jgi:hypothetical protein
MQDPAIRDQRTKRVERWKDSGLTAKEFAAETGINAQSLSRWRWHLSKDTDEPKPRRRRRSQGATGEITRSPAPSPMTFVEMTAPAALAAGSHDAFRRTDAFWVQLQIIGA